jgi:hypothetical protein
MNNRPTPDTDAEWDRLQMLPGGGYSSKLAGAKLAFGMANWAASLERQRDEARELARELRDALRVVYNLPDSCPCGITNEAMAAWHDVGIVLGKAKEVLP